MPPVNRAIVVGTVIIMAAGAYRVLVLKPDATSPRGHTVTRVLVGGYVLAVVASIIDLVGGPVSHVAGLLLALAVMTALYAVLPDVFSRINARNDTAGPIRQPGGGMRS